MADLKAQGQRIDDYCWDLYARVSQWYEAPDPEKQERKNIRLETLHAIEAGGNETAEIADLLSTAVLRRHLETMLRLGIEYDFLPRESEILHLKFWDLAFAQLKAKGVLYLETEGQEPGLLGHAPRFDRRRDCRRRRSGGRRCQGDRPFQRNRYLCRARTSPITCGSLACWAVISATLASLPTTITCAGSRPRRARRSHPDFGGAQAIYNVIDSRQADPQANVIEALRGLGYTEAAAHYVHFSYEMVALTPRCALELGYQISEEDQGRSYIEVSGRKGFGVKADALLDRLTAAAKEEVDSRHPQRSQEERQGIAHQIAVGALRYFMLKFTRNSVIAFDFKEALSFEGETGPYVQYAVVRARNIFRKAGTTPEAALVGSECRGLLRG